MGMSESSKPSASELKELMRRVLESDASEAFEQFMLRQLALSDMAPAADEALLDGITASPDGGAAMAQAHLSGLTDKEREELLERAGMETGRRLHAAAYALLAAVRAAPRRRDPGDGGRGGDNRARRLDPPTRAVVRRAAS
jgi:hypothetical protein